MTFAKFKKNKIRCFQNSKKLKLKIQTGKVFHNLSKHGLIVNNIKVNGIM